MREGLKALIEAEPGAGLVLRSGDAESLAQAVRRMMNPAARLRMGRAGREAVRERYNWEADSAVLLRAVEAAVRGASCTAAAPSRDARAGPTVAGFRA